MIIYVYIYIYISVCVIVFIYAYIHMTQGQPKSKVIIQYQRGVIESWALLLPFILCRGILSFC